MVSAVARLLHHSAKRLAQFPRVFSAQEPSCNLETLTACLKLTIKADGLLNTSEQCGYVAKDDNFDWLKYKWSWLAMGCPSTNFGVILSLFQDTWFRLFLYARLQTGRIMVWWCPSVRPGLRPSVRPSQFSALFSYMLWHIDLKFCVSLYFYVRKIKFECHQFPSLFAGVMFLFNFKLLQICSFPHFSPTCFDILSSNFVYDFVLMYHRASLSVVILHQFLLELCLFVNLEYSKYTVFRTFLLHALTYWAEILHMTLFYCTTDQVRVPSIFVGVMPLLELRILEIHSFLHFSLTPLNILSWKFAYYFVFLYYRSSLSVFSLRLFWSYASFRT